MDLLDTNGNGWRPATDIWSLYGRRAGHGWELLGDGIGHAGSLAFFEGVAGRLGRMLELGCG